MRRAGSPRADVGAGTSDRTGKHGGIVRVRCDFCGAEYETAVPRSALLVVNRCDRCGLSSLSVVEERHEGAEPADDHVRELHDARRHASPRQPPDGP